MRQRQPQRLLLNQGLGFAFDQLAVDYVVTFDQDSTPEIGLPSALVQALEAEAEADHVACLGPRLLDRKSAHASYAYDQSAECRLLRQVDQLSGLIDARDAAERKIASHLGDVLATQQHIAETIAQMHHLVHRSAP